jgi:glyoxylase-like metal-dependent hydrolase (beta-lactamase superfamily II)
MRELADDVFVLQGMPGYVVNCYLVGDVLVDAATRLDAPLLLRQLRGRALSAHALTHAHPDHNGSSAAVCRARGVPYWVGADDAAAARDGTIVRTSFPRLPLGALWDRTLSGPPHPVDRELREGDQVAGFTVLDTPGHTHGHIALWRERDRVLIAGDILLGFGPRRHVEASHVDRARNEQSLRRIVELRPELVCFGHGPPLRDAAPRLEALVAG